MSDMSGGSATDRPRSQIRLNDEQSDVAQIKGDLPLKVIAGAGTGKTETLAARFVALVRAGVPPHRVLLLTFTEEAAVEMRARVMQRLREYAPEIPPEQLIDLWCHTFHGFGVRLVREYGWALRLPPTPRILDQQDQQQVVDELVIRWEDTPHHSVYRPLEHTSYGWENGEAWNKALGVLHVMRDSSATPADLGPHPDLREQQDARFAAERAQLTPLIEHSHQALEDYLRTTGTLDYPALIDAAARLLETVPHLRDQFIVVMIDEFQDTNPAQLNLLTHLRPDWSATTVVGDPRQAIFGWRSAHPDSLRLFPYGLERAYADRPLRENYRSHAAICAVANLALHGSELAREVPLVAARTSEAVHTVLADLRPVSLFLLPSVEAEATLVAEQMRSLLDQGVRPTSMALLLRARTRLRVFTDALLAVGVPFRVSGGAGFYREPVVRLITSLLQFLQDPEDRTAAAHLWEHPVLGVGYWGLEVWERQGDEPNARVRAAKNWWRWLVEPELMPDSVSEREQVIGKLAHFKALYHEARARAMLFGPSDFLMWLFEASGLHAWYSAHDDHQALRDVRKLVALADEWQSAERALTVAGYTRRLRAHVMGEIPSAEKEPVPLEYTVDAVEISTVHGAKGREWPVVFLAETSLPSRRSRNVAHVLWDVQWKMVISDNKASGKGAADPLAELRHDLRRRSRNEERAIWYVALTRARDRLVVTHSGCQVDADAHFDDVSVTPNGMHSDEDVHFFHELWELVRANPENLAETVVYSDANDSQ